MKQSGIL